MAQAVPRKPYQPNPQLNYGPNPGRSGQDPRGRVQNQSVYQQQRFEGQQDPVYDQSMINFGRGSEADFNNYNDIMGRYRDVSSGGGGISPRSIGYTDPFKSYGGYEEFSKTGGYSPSDIANLRSRGVSPIRAAYSNAQREVGRARSLQGGYSPNAVATQAKMAREQSQGMADATQNVEAGLAESVNRGRLSGLSGMSGIEGQRLNADLDVGKFNASSAMLADQQNRANQLAALQGMSSLYGTTPGMAGKFGDQALDAAKASGDFGLNLMGRDIQSQDLPGRFENTEKYITAASRLADPFLEYFRNRNKKKTLGARPTALPSGMMPASR